MNSKVNTSLLDMQLEKERCEKEHLFFTRRFFLPRIRWMNVEDKAHGTQLIQNLGTYAGVPCIAIQRGTDKLTRFMDVQVHLEHDYENNPHDRLVMLPIGQPWVAAFIEECEAFTADMTHDHDDQVDTLIDAIEEATVKQNYEPPMGG